MSFKKADKVKEVKPEVVIKEVVTCIPPILGTNTKVAARLAEIAQTGKKNAEEAVKNVMMAIRNELLECGAVTLPGLGILKIVEVPEREYKNRLTGEEKSYQIHAHQKLIWKTTKSLTLGKKES